jgi:proteasome accessory factor C
MARSDRGGSAVSRRGPRAAADRLRRLLVLLPWLMERGEVSVAAIAAQFHMTEAEVVADLETASLCGLPPYLDEMVDLYVEDGVVHVGVPRLFQRPLRLTAQEGFTLLAAARAALALPGADPEGPLARAVDRLAAVLGATAPLVIELDQPPFLDAVRQAVELHERLEVTYYAAYRDELTERRIDPQGVFADRGNWYVVADDEASGAQRTFRIDRIESCRPTGERFAGRDVAVPPAEWFDAGVRLATLRLPPSAAWVAETYPVAEATVGDDGWWRVRLPVAGVAWLERLLLRAGPGAVVEEPDELASTGPAAATRLLARYR